MDGTGQLSLLVTRPRFTPESGQIRTQTWVCLPQIVCLSDPALPPFLPDTEDRGRVL